MPGTQCLCAPGALTLSCVWVQARGEKRMHPRVRSVGSHCSVELLPGGERREAVLFPSGETRVRFILSTD